MPGFLKLCAWFLEIAFLSVNIGMHAHTHVYMYVCACVPVLEDNNNQ